MPRTCALIPPFQPTLYRVSRSNKTIKIYPNTMKRSKTWVRVVTEHCQMHPYSRTHQIMSLGSNGLDRVRSLRKFKCDFVAQTCALIAPVQPILHRVSCSIETLQNAPKCYETHQNVSLGSNGLDRVRSLWKILTRLHGTNFALVWLVLHRISWGNQMVPNAPK